MGSAKSEDEGLCSAEGVLWEEKGNDVKERGMEMVLLLIGGNN